MKKEVFQDRLIETFTTCQDRIAIQRGDHIISYSQLDQKSNAIANYLINRGVEPGNYIGILLEERVEIIPLLVGIVKAGCVFVTMNIEFPKKTISNVIANIDLDIIFTDRHTFNKFPADSPIKTQGAEYVFTEEIISSSSLESFTLRQEIQYQPEDKIYVYFTSGTTGVPKAVVGKNKSLLHYVNYEIEAFKVNPGCHFSQFLIPNFDPYSRDIFVPLCAGGTICIPEDMDVILDPVPLKEWISTHSIQVIHCAPSLFRIINSAKLSCEDFNDLKTISLAGEKINPSDLKDWYETFGERIQLVNCYGPTETTMAKVFYFIKQEDLQRERIPVGKPMRGCRVIIMDLEMKVCEPLVAGEIYIRTPYRSHGYCNDPELNAEKFLPNPFNPDPNDIIYRTGDLGRILLDGDLDILGRVDRQVKIRGYRIELEGIETMLSHHRSIGEAVVLRREISESKEYLCAYITNTKTDEIKKETLVSNVLEYLSEEFPDYMIPYNILVLEEIPKKLNGKVDFDKLIALESEYKRECVPPRDKIEKKLLEMWAKLLKVKEFGITNHFFELGGSSLNIMVLVSRFHKFFQVKIGLKEMFDNPTIEQQAMLIRGAQKIEHISIKPVEKREYYPVSSAQKRLYVLQQMEPASFRYNLPNIVVLKGECQKEIFENIFSKLIQRHESLRTSFVLVGQEAVQLIHQPDDNQFLLEHVDISANPGQEDKEIINAFVRPFNLNQAPLLRVGIIKKSQEESVLMMDMHHIISDGTSLKLFVNECVNLYAGKTFPELRIQYKDFSEWQNLLVTTGIMKKQENYWVENLQGELPKLKLMTDFPRTIPENFEGNRIRFYISKEITTRIKEINLEIGTTLNIFLLTVYYVLLGKYSGQEDIIVGAGIAGRMHADLDPIIGMFVNMLCLRNYPKEEITFREFLGEVKQNSLEAYENQDYQFDELVRKLGIQVEFGKNPIFETVFTFQNAEAQTEEGAKTPASKEAKAPGLWVAPYHYERPLMQFDLCINAIESGDRIEMLLYYLTSLYKSSTAREMAEHYVEILEQVLENLDKRLSEISISHGLLAGKTKVEKNEYTGFEF